MLNEFKKKCRLLLDCCFPPTCLGCHALCASHQKDLCAACWVAFSAMKEGRLSRRIWGQLKPVYASAYLTFAAQRRVQTLLYGLKYRHNPEAALRLGRWCGQRFLRRFPDHGVEAILPVPLHPIRRAQRGYNQSERLAQGIAEVLQRPCQRHWLIRTRHTSPQHSQPAEARLQNVAHAFDLTQEARVKGSHILLVDDLITSGATILACSQPLLRALVGKISFVALASTSTPSW